MKKTFYIAMASLAVLTGCTETADEMLSGKTDAIVLNNEPVEIRLSSSLGETYGVETRAVANDATSGNNRKLQNSQFAPATDSWQSRIAVYVEDHGKVKDGSTGSAYAPYTTYTKGLQYTPDGSGALTVTDAQKQYYPSNNQEVDIYAYYPGHHDALMKSGGTMRDRQTENITFNVQTDQESFDNYALSDLMYGTPNQKRNTSGGTTTISNPVTRTTQTVNLLFNHLLSKVNINLKTDGLFQHDQPTTTGHLTGGKVTIQNTRIDANFNFKEGEIVETSAGSGNYHTTAAANTSTNKKPIHVMTLREKGVSGDSQNDADGNAGGWVSATETTAVQHGSAVIVPQTITANGTVHLIDIDLPNQGHYFYAPKTSSNSFKFEPGKEYTFTITLTNTELVVSTTITQWTSADTSAYPGTGDAKQPL